MEKQRYKEKNKKNLCLLNEVMVYETNLIEAPLSCRKALNGATPVPGPIRMRGVLVLLGNLKSGFLLINTGQRSPPWRRSCRKQVVTPSLSLPNVE